MIKEDIITGNAFKQICDDFIDEEKTYIDIKAKPKIIFLKTDWIEIFKNKVLPLIDYQFKLVTHNSDRSAISGNLDLLEDKRLIRWFGMNVDTKHPKLQPIPIGIANEKWPHGDKNILIELVNTNIHKTNFVYSNFNIGTNVKERLRVKNFVQETKFITLDLVTLDYRSYLQKLKSYQYVISPPGNSIDCHRIWESIYLGVIPIVEKHPALEYWHDLPILFVDSFNDVNIEMLETKYQQLVDKSKEKAIMSYYSNMII